MFNSLSCRQGQLPLLGKNRKVLCCIFWHWIPLSPAERALKCPSFSSEFGIICVSIWPTSTKAWRAMLLSQKPNCVSNVSLLGNKPATKRRQHVDMSGNWTMLPRKAEAQVGFFLCCWSQIQKETLSQRHHQVESWRAKGRRHCWHCLLFPGMWQVCSCLTLWNMWWAGGPCWNWATPNTIGNVEIIHLNKFIYIYMYIYISISIFISTSKLFCVNILIFLVLYLFKKNIKIKIIEFKWKYELFD